MKKIIPIILGFIIFSSFLCTNGSKFSVFAISDNMQQACYTEDYTYFDQNGKQAIRDVGEQYKFLVKVNSQAVTSIKTSNPNIKFENLVGAFKADSDFQKMLRINICLKSNGFDPNSVEIMSNNLAQIVDASIIPEFGSLAGMIITISTIGVIVVSRRFRFQIG